MDANAPHDNLQTYVAEQLGHPSGVFILDDIDFVKKDTTSAGVQRQYSGTAMYGRRPPKALVGERDFAAGQGS